MRVGLFVALAVAACGDAAPSHPHELGSGSRLKLSWYAFDDGSRQLAPGPLHDAQRDEYCSAIDWTGGESYCTPIDPMFPGYLSISTSSACEEEHVYALPEAHDEYVASFDGALVDRLYTLEPATIAQFWTRSTDGSCEGPSDGTGMEFFRRGAEVPRSALARTYRISSPDVRLTVLALTSDDGLYRPDGIRDNQLGFDCALTEVSADEVVCDMPSFTWLSYTDDACTTPVLRVFAGVTPPTHVSGQRVCGHGLYEVGAVTRLAAPVYESLEGTCFPVSTGSEDFYQLIEREPAHLVRRRVDGGGRLQPIEIVADDGTLPTGFLYDTTESGECAPQRPDLEAVDHVRCDPVDHGRVRTYYRDASCQTAAQLVDTPTAPPSLSCAASGPRASRSTSTAAIAASARARPRRCTGSSTARAPRRRDRPPASTRSTTPARRSPSSPATSCTTEPSAPPACEDARRDEQLHSARDADRHPRRHRARPRRARARRQLP